MSDAKDIRDLTRAINRLHDVIEVFNRNLVAVEQKKQLPANSGIFARRLAALCTSCENGNCDIAPFNQACTCCRRNHDVPK